MRGYRVTTGINEGTFKSLTERQRKALVKIMARIAERSYRRGAQQGAHVAQNRPQCLPPSLADWRYDNSLDRSPWLDWKRKPEPSTCRLFTENPDLEELGFEEPEPTKGNARRFQND
jgi:hypothetical protein